VRAPTILATALGILVLGAVPGFAHVGLVPGEIASGATEAAQVVLAHGCGEDGTVPENEEASSATSAVTLEIPPGLRLTPQEVDGWTLTFEDGEQADRARWAHDAPEGASGTVFLDLLVDATDLAPGTQVWVPVTQECVDGTVMAWDHPGAATTVEDLPAMSLRTATATVATTAGDGLPTPVLVSLVVSLAVIAGGAAVAITGRRSR
jgi:periplasmic copper chaperone A